MIAGYLPCALKMIFHLVSLDEVFDASLWVFALSGIAGSIIGGYFLYKCWDGRCPLLEAIQSHYESALNNVKIERPSQGYGELEGTSRKA
jgi:hypothetical protein